jgi:hypothetical protein
METTTMRIIIAAVLIVLLAEGQPASSIDNTAQPVTTSQAPADFAVRVEQYATLHRRLERTAPLVVSQDWSTVRAASDALADKIRAERANAERGDVFTPEVERWVRQILAGCRDGIVVEEFLADMNEEDWEAFAFLPEVNQRWPEEAPLPTMSPHLLAVLPPLPQELQYRFVNRDLILWDARANLIVDYLTGALP